MPQHMDLVRIVPLGAIVLLALVLTLLLVEGWRASRGAPRHAAGITVRSSLCGGAPERAELATRGVLPGGELAALDGLDRADDRLEYYDPGSSGFLTQPSSEWGLAATASNGLGGELGVSVGGVSPARIEGELAGYLAADPLRWPDPGRGDHLGALGAAPDTEGLHALYRPDHDPLTN
jgi:hypothetical protein